MSARVAARATRAAQQHGARIVPWDRLADELTRADLVVSATASAAPVLEAPLMRTALAHRDQPLVIFDLAVPRDVAPEVAALPGVTVIDLTTLSSSTESRRTVDKRSRAAVRNRPTSPISSLRNVTPTV